MRNYYSAVLLCVTSLMAFPALADNIVDHSNEIIKSRIEERFPQIKVESVEPATVSGLYEVMTNTELAYTNADASVLIVGRMVDTVTKQDITARRWNEKHAIDFSELPFELAMKEVKGDGSRKLVVFADPLCPYCKQLEEQLQELTDITVYTFLLPLEGIHPGATKVANDIWCSTSRQEAWLKWMINKTAPETNACNVEPLAKTKELSVRLKINSTPTLFFADGHRVAGVVANSDLIKNFPTTNSSN